MTSLGTFVCSRCAGLHRELNHKVKGISMSVFNDREVEILSQWGNERAAKVWLHGLKESAPAPKETYKLKEYMRTVYEQKRYYKEVIEETKEQKPKADNEQPPKPRVLIDINVGTSAETEKSASVDAEATPSTAPAEKISSDLAGLFLDESPALVATIPPTRPDLLAGLPVPVPFFTSIDAGKQRTPSDYLGHIPKRACSSIKTNH